MSENARSGRSKLWLIAAVCATPVVASYFMFYLSPPAKRTYHGELLETRPLPEARLVLADGTAFESSRLRGKWVLLMVDAGNCTEFCRRKLFTMRQLRQGQGNDMERIERVWLISDETAVPATVMDDFCGTLMVRAAGSAWLAQLPVARATSDYLYVIDPLGNLVLRYGREVDPVNIIKDLVRLLKTSRIG